MVCDLSSMEQIRRFAEEFKAKYDQLHVLINNAGAVFFKRLTTVDGFERTLAVDYLAPFLLTHEFLPLLKSSAPSRIINISSGLHTSGRVNLDDLQSTENYKGMQVYRNAKLMLIMFTYELARRLERTGVTANVALPGFAATNLGKDGGSRMQWWSFKMVRFMQINAKEAAETPLYLASSKEVEGITSKCFRKLKEMPTAPVSYDQQMQKSLWDATSKMLSTSFPQL
jgi:NAD(P)-dependent dehydrogenase (short-subunit alcohol dehydrogenase family)